MSYNYSDISGLLNDVISNKVGVSSLSNELLEELLYHIADVIEDKEVEFDSDNEKLASVLENIAKTMELRVINDSADDFSGALLASATRGCFGPIEPTFTLQ